MNASESTGHLDVGGVFDAAGDIFKRSFGSVWIVALILLIPAEIIASLLGDQSRLLSTLGTIIHWVAIAWLAGAVVRIVQNVEIDGRVDFGVGEILGSVAPLLISIVLLQLVVWILVAIGTFFLIVPGVILALMWCVAVPSMVVEKLGVFDSMTRSSDLTRDNRMRILSIGLLIFLALIGLTFIVIFLSLVEWWLGAIVGIVLGVMVYPYISILAAVLYFRLRDLKEGGAVAVEETVIVEERIDPVDPPPAV